MFTLSCITSPTFKSNSFTFERTRACIFIYYYSVSVMAVNVSTIFVFLPLNVDKYVFCGQLMDLETHLQRLKSDLHNCVGFIQEPKKLKDSMKMIYSRYVSQTNWVSGSNSRSLYSCLSAQVGVILTTSLLFNLLCMCCFQGGEGQCRWRRAECILSSAWAPGEDC